MISNIPEQKKKLKWGYNFSRNTAQLVDRLADKIQDGVSFYLFSLNIE